MIARVRYSKGESVKYVGHLDTMRTFMRCIKRTVIPVEYSKGFNPRIQISFALPLGVGVTSEEEFFDLKILERMNEDMFLGELNSTLPSGFRTYNIEFLDNDKISLMSLVKEAVYEIRLDCSFEFSKIEELFREDKILAQKESKSKKQKEELNLKDFIIDIKFNNKEKTLTTHTTAGSKNNLNPVLLITTIEKKLGKINNYDICRKRLILK